MSVWIADALVVIGVAVITVAVLGAVRLPDVYMRLHAAGKAAALGILTVAAAPIPGGDAELTVRALLAATFVLLTAPVSAHAVAKAAVERREPMRAPDTVDEAGLKLADEKEEEEKAA